MPPADIPADLPVTHIHPAPRADAVDGDALIAALLALSASLDPTQVLSALVHHACALTGATRAILVRRDAGGAFIAADARQASGEIRTETRRRVADAAVASRMLALPLGERGGEDDCAADVLYLAPAGPGGIDASRLRRARQLVVHAALSLAHADAHTRLLQENEQLACAEEALRTSQELLKQGERFNHAGSMRYLVREDLMFCSDELCRIYGLEEGRNCITYDEFAALMHPDDRQEVIDTVDTAVAMGGTIRVEHRICRRDTGEVRYISGIGKPVWIDGTFVEYVGTATDITVRRQAEFAMRAAQADLERVARANTVGQLTASIAHEVNQPLMSIVSNAGASLRWLERDPPHLDNARAGLRDIVAEGQRAGGMIAGLQGLTRNTEPVFERIDLNTTIRHILKISRSELQRRDIGLTPALASEELWVLGDMVQLQQVLLNLVINAIDAMTGITDRPRLLTVRSAGISEERVEVVVQDTGEGITPDALPRVFDAFYTTKENGMGMGLAICRSIVEHHRGRLRAAAAGNGTKFSFDLPRVP